MSVARPNPQMAKMVKDSGILIEGIYEDLKNATTYDEAATIILTAMETDQYLGITRGGVSYSVNNESRIVEYDGRRVRVLFDFTVDESTPQIETNLLIHDIGNLQRVYPMSDVIVDGEKTELIPRLGTPQPADYMPDLCWVRDFSDGSISVDVLLNAINTSPGNKTGADKSESELPVVFIGVAAHFSETEHSPTRMLQFNKV